MDDWGENAASSVSLIPECTTRRAVIKAFLDSVQK